jgi:hypothetical protein
MALPGAWEAWLSSSLAALEGRQLLRSLRPVVPTDSPVEVVVPRETMAEWLAGTLSTGACSVQPGDPAPLVRGVAAARRCAAARSRAAVAWPP